MISAKRIGIVLALIAAISVTAICVSNFDQNSATASGVKVVKVLRRKDKKQDKPTAAESVSAQTLQDKNEREFENKVPPHLPIKVRLRAQKEQAAKDLANDRWHRDLELEVKNTGDKPIYYLSIVVEIPEIQLGGNPVSVLIRYGERSLFDDSKGHASPDDVPIAPKQTVFLGLTEDSAKGWEQWQKKENWSQPRKVALVFEELSFGDGTGFFGGNGAPWPFPKNRQSSTQTAQYLPKRTSLKSHHVNFYKPGTTTSKRIGGESATLWPTSFCDSTSNGISEAYDPYLTSCCPNGCRLIDPETYRYCYYCVPVTRAVGVQCIYEEDGICATVEGSSKLCSDNVYCPLDNIFPCGYVAPSPTPTPTPTPEPTCDPATQPNISNCGCSVLTTGPYGEATAQWSCICSLPGQTGLPSMLGRPADYSIFPGTPGYGGCPENMYNFYGTDCCACLVTTCPNGDRPNRNTCECPSPTPTPTPAGGGSGPPDPSPAPIEHVDCVDYYWVHFLSYDGGQTWQYADNESYAGCFYIY